MRARAASARARGARETNPPAFITIAPYLVEQNRMANAQLLGYGSKHLGQNFFFLQ
jgi:hypothetical protein